MILSLSKKNAENPSALFVGFILLHIPLALVMSFVVQVATIHAIITFSVGFFLAVTTHEFRKIAWITGYICGAEVLWRMTNAQVFWEFGKYSIIALMVVRLLRFRRIKSAGLPLLFFGLLTLSLPLILFNLPIGQVRDVISFNLSGPLSLSVCVLFFSQTYLSWEDREKLIWYVVAPILGIAILCLQGINSAGQLSFAMESNFTASGGFGPNQVSAILGLGALMMILLVVQSRAIGKKMIALGLSISLLTLCVLTFSRGGIYNVVASLFVVAVLTFRNSRLRVAYFSVILIILLIIGFYIYPELDQFTGGMLKTRFSNVDTTGRSDIAKAQLSIWVNNPILGVGPGMSSNTLENEFGVAIASHTEYARFLSEHGIPGAIALFIILLIGIKAYLRTPFGFPQAWMAALLVWPLMEMTHAAMRIAAIGFIFGLSTAKWKLENGKGLTGR